MSAWLIITIVSIASMPVAYDMARDRGRSTEAWLGTAMIIGPLGLLALLIPGKRRAGKTGRASNQATANFKSGHQAFTGIFSLRRLTTRTKEEQYRGSSQAGLPSNANRNRAPASGGTGQA